MGPESYIEYSKKNADALLFESRSKLPERLTPEAAYAEMLQGSKLIDIRRLEQRMAGGDIPGAIRIHRNEFEWRCDPSSPWCDESITAYDYSQRLIIICNQGYQSSLAAAILQDFGMPNVTDVDGGFEAWKAADQPWAEYSDPEDNYGKPTA